MIQLEAGPVGNPRPPQRPGHQPISPGRDYRRVWLAALVLAAAVALLLPDSLGWAVRGVAAWDAALVVLLGYPWRLIVRSDARATRTHAAIEDPGKVVLFFITVVAATVSLFTAVFLLRSPEAYMPGGRVDLVGVLVALGMFAVVGAWLLVHTAFTFHRRAIKYVRVSEPWVTRTARD